MRDQALNRKPVWLASGFLLALMAGSSAATQWLAWRYGQSRLLGSNWNGIYPPWGAVLWYLRWPHNHPELYRQAAGLGALVFLGILGALTAATLPRLLPNEW